MIIFSKSTLVNKDTVEKKESIPIHQIILIYNISSFFKKIETKYCTITVFKITCVKNNIVCMRQHTNTEERIILENIIILNHTFTASFLFLISLIKKYLTQVHFLIDISSKLADLFRHLL